MEEEVVYVSNGGRVGDGWRMCLVSEQGQKLAFMVNQKTGRTSDVKLRRAEQEESEPEPQDGIPVANPADLSELLDIVAPGSTFILPPGQYAVTYDPALAFKFVALTGHSITEMQVL